MDTVLVGQHHRLRIWELLKASAYAFHFRSMELTVEHPNGQGATHSLTLKQR